MKIEIWSDFACPFCYIGKQKLEDALQQFPHQEQVSIEFKSYQLDPDTPPYNGQNYYESMAKKFGSAERVKEMTKQITKQAEQVNLTFNFDKVKQTNTFDAHRLTKFAKQHNKDVEMTDRLLRAHFTDGKDIGNTDTLTELAEQVNLNKDEVRSMLQDKNSFSDAVNNDISEAQQFEITGVPFFLINRKYALSGAQPTEVFTQALNQVWEEEKQQAPFQDLSTNNDNVACDDNGCTTSDKSK